MVGVRKGALANIYFPDGSVARLDSGTRLVVEAGNFAARVLTLGAPLREILSSETDESVEKQLDTAKKEIKQKINEKIRAMKKRVREQPEAVKEYRKELQAAIAMTEKLTLLNVKLKKNGKPEIGMRIGIYTGPALAGNIGSELRLNYTVMGDTVNVASRLEGINKEYGTQIIIGESTKNKLKGKYDLRGKDFNIYYIDLYHRLNTSSAGLPRTLYSLVNGKSSGQ